MKKNPLLLAAFLVVISITLAQAEIKDSVDSFNNRRNISSVNSISCGESICFLMFGSTMKAGETPTIWFLTVGTPTSKMQIPERLDLKVELTPQGVRMVEGLKPVDKKVGAGHFNITENTPLLKQATKITFRVYFWKGGTITREIPDYVLEEWKKVLEIK